MGIPHQETGPMARHRHGDVEYIKIKCFTFGFVRDPLSWLRSRWSYACKTGALDRWVELRKENPKKHGFLIDCFSRDWDFYINKVAEKYAGMPSNDMLRRLGYDYDGNWFPKIPINFIGRTESLRTDLIKALSLAGEKFDKKFILNRPKRNTSDQSKEGKFPPQIRNKILEANSFLMEEFYS